MKLNEMLGTDDLTHTFKSRKLQDGDLSVRWCFNCYHSNYRPLWIPGRKTEEALAPIDDYKYTVM